MKRICLVTSAHISYNPRLVKEADALSDAGFAVRVVAMSIEQDKAGFDAALARSRQWCWQTCQARRESPGGKWRWLHAACRQKLYDRLLLLHSLPGGLERAYCRYYPELIRLAAREPTDLFIAHNLPALPVACAAARQWKAKLGFDAEDYHRGEFEEVPETARIRELTARIEERYIPLCDYMTAASQGIAASYAKALGIPEPLTVLNVFPRADRQGKVPIAVLRSERQGAGFSVYWYSQVIGPDRGLEDALRATAILRPHVSLHVRGQWASGYERSFMELATQLGVSNHVHHLPPVPPHELIERAAQHDVGLALEIGHTANRQVALTNKLFTYLVAGIALAASDVRAQRAIMCEVADAGFLFPSGQPELLAAGLKRWLDDPPAFRRAQERSRFYGDTRFCWEVESQKLVHAVQSVLK